MDMNTAAELEHDRRQGQLQDFWNHNRDEIRRRALAMALAEDDANDRIIDIVGDETWEPDDIICMGQFVRIKLIEQYEEKAELELRRECGL